ncbi:MAG: glycogen synthase GlgA [Myxococcales bacterium]|nr:glycogen synthase GlgA [Myxococcales bacterium]
MRILAVASEVAPWAATGGLADVVAALPPALTAADREVRIATVVPLYRATRQRLAAAGVALGPGRGLVLAIGERIVAVTVRPAAGVWFVECDPLYDRDGLYGDADGRDHDDNPMRFAVLARAALAAAPTILDGPIDVVHGHDWQGSLAVAYAAQDDLPAARITTIHNLAYRGLCSKDWVPRLGLPWSVFDHHRAEFYDQLSLLKAGLAYADLITTVSPTYAREILTPERGEGLDGFLRTDVARIVGITNGIDTAAWDPRTDPALPARFTRAERRGKVACRAALAAELGLAVTDETPIVAAVARLTPQKGIDLLADVVPTAIAAGARVVVLGSGDRDLEDRLRGLAAAFPGALAVRLAFDPAIARRIYAGADLFAMPSRFEPCGLGQLYAMRYGTVPVVAAVGGLADTVIDAAAPDGTGFRFEVIDAPGLWWALARAITSFRDDRAEFDAIAGRAMARDVSWRTAARDYLGTFRAARRARTAGP